MGAVSAGGGEPDWWDELRSDQVARLRRDRAVLARARRPEDLERALGW